ncbi:hypothetical protein DM01DRAFT_1382289 [Hesseltinella vesiculosa]|uniref:Uncharacterized protein n=1 Tax=Hesseltinella vesiculosa TaxID=101127 RepID=A0A1X2GLY1_9FUNG|nr:hypothetical protein DM01DRAFT_1382289 [Hesseltinella vesiculosa]
MNFSTAKKFSQGRFIHTSHSSLKKCCGCIHLRIGGVLATCVWAGFTLYFAVISFQIKSPFYSYMQAPPLIVFGVINLLFFLLCLMGLFCLFMNSWKAVRYYIRSLWFFLFLMLGDAFINMVLFGTYQSDYQQWCISNAQAALPNGTSIANTGQDYYNCAKLWQDEFKFSLICVVLMSSLSIYWATCLYSYSHKLRAMEVWAFAQVYGVVDGVAPYYEPPPGVQEPDVIVLQNKKPSRYDKDTQDADDQQPSTSNGLIQSLKRLTAFKSTASSRNAVHDHAQRQTSRLPQHVTMPSSGSPLGHLPSFSEKHDSSTVIEIN